MLQFKQINYNYILDQIFFKLKKINPIDYIIGCRESFSFRRNVYRVIVNLFDNLKKNKFCLLRVDNQFNLIMFCEYIKEVYPFIKIHNTKFCTIFKYKNRLIIVTKHKGLFIKLHKNKKELIKKLKNKHSVSKVHFVLFIKDEYKLNVLKFMCKKRYNDIICENCLEYLLKSRLLHSKHKKHLDLYKLIKLKEKYNTRTAYELIYTMCLNTRGLDINYLENLNIEKYLKSKLFSQDKALNAILAVINNTDLNPEDNKKPLGSWILCGPSGTGKTELAKILSYALFNSTKNLLKIDMSEYMERHSISKLIGSPQGYVNYGEDTALSAKFKQSSSLVIVFDEIEKAYKEFTTIMLQVLDEGKLVLATGKKLNFNKSFIIFTSNLGYSERSRHKNITKKAVLKKVKDFFRIEFLNRLNDVIIFDPVSISHSYDILNKFLVGYAIRFNFKVDINNSLIDSIILHTYNKIYGSRPLRRAADYTFDMFNLSGRLFNFSKNYFVDYSNKINYDNKIDNKFNSFEIN